MSSKLIALSIYENYGFYTISKSNGCYHQQDLVLYLLFKHTKKKSVKKVFHV